MLWEVLFHSGSDMEAVDWREWQETLTADGWDEALVRAKQRARMHRAILVSLAIAEGTSAHSAPSCTPDTWVIQARTHGRNEWHAVDERQFDSWIEADSARADLEKHHDWNDLRIVKASSARS